MMRQKRSPHLRFLLIHHIPHVSPQVVIKGAKSGEQGGHSTPHNSWKQFIVDSEVWQLMIVNLKEV
jgi:hypothetical protein